MAQAIFTRDLRRAQARFRAALRKREGEAAGDLIREFGRAFHGIQRELLPLLDKIEAARAADEDVSPAWLFQRDRLRALERQVAVEIDTFAEYADGRVQEEQTEAIRLAGTHSEEAVRSAQAYVAWDRLPVAALRELVGASHSGPLRGLLDSLGPQASDRVRSELVKGVALGRNPRQIARGVRNVSHMTLNRALTISRTETLRAYRTATLENYRRNAGVVKGWIWLAAGDERTCPVCEEQDGTFHPLDEEMDSHPCCRCTPAPDTGTTP